ncbi:hypothetical protein ACIRRA_30700 [Nocardia sp. NPDC101769]|uniref:hypothetical protein n=1 Tax=Nocardia sp. NPDC101769 TaxID=3364333 RepID=UPI003802059B
MTTQRREPAELAALRVERNRLRTVHFVLSDIVNAACDTSQQKGYRDCAAEEAKRVHWAAVYKPVLAEFLAASEAYSEARWGSESVTESRAATDRAYANDPDMRALVVKARADLAARRQSGKSVERDRRRSR